MLSHFKQYSSKSFFLGLPGLSSQHFSHYLF
uniref:Uncharacterized protein n=1 Tax=Rhizophora mucronata TaxID=61149 RepID=A0A2P2NWV7_RHIMU